MAEEQASGASKLKIASFFVKSTPINEVKFAVQDVDLLINDKALFNDSVKASLLGEYNLAQMVHFEDGDHKFLVSEFNRVSDNTFYDADLDKTFTVDHTNKLVLSSKPGVPASAADSALRSEVAKAVRSYIAASYKKDKCVAGVFLHGSELVVCISAINTNLGAFWTGNWRAVYRVPLGGGAAAPLTATLDVNVHYFEDGNIQLKAGYAPQGVTVNAANAEDIVAAIGKVETEWQGNLEKMYIDMHHSTFKAMRRMLPITKTHMNWNTSTHSLAEEVSR